MRTIRLPSAPGDPAQHRRAQQYARCTHALRYDRITDGAEGVFDQALTNGLTAIVAHAWPGQERSGKGRTLSAAQLLDVVQANGKPAAHGVVRVLHDPAGPEFHPEPPYDVLEDVPPLPNFTEVAIPALRDALNATQAIRHARDIDTAPTRGITGDHLQALTGLDYHPALGTLNVENLDRYEQSVEEADQAEVDRATAYLEALGEDERQRRAAINWVEQYAWETKDDACYVEDCPVCSNVSLVARHRDRQLDEIGIGHCAVCSYYRSAETAESLALELEITRAVDRAH